MQIHPENQNQTAILQTTDINSGKQVDKSGAFIHYYNRSLYFQHCYHDHQWKTYILGFFLLIIAVNFFCNVALLVGNINQQEIIEEHYYMPFHQLDFCGAFVFALCEGCVLVMAGIVSFENFRMYLIICNIGGTMVALILFNFNPEYFEKNSHWLEYSIQLLLTLTDFLFIFQSQTNSPMQKYRYQETFIIIVAFILAIFKLLLYGQVVPNDDPERLAHFLEYIGEMVNDCFAFFFVYIQMSQESQSAVQLIQTQFNKLQDTNWLLQDYNV